MEKTINDLLLKIIRDSWFGILSCSTEKLTEQQFKLVWLIGSGIGDGLLYINGELINTAPSAGMTDEEQMQAAENLYDNFPKDLQKFRRKYPNSSLVVLFN